MPYERTFPYLQVVKQVAQVVDQIIHRVGMDSTNFAPAMSAQVIRNDADFPLLHYPDLVIPDLGIATYRMYQDRCLAVIRAVDLVVHTRGIRRL